MEIQESSDVLFSTFLDKMATQLSQFRVCETTNANTISAAMRRHVGPHRVRVYGPRHLDARMYSTNVGGLTVLGLTYGTEVMISSPNQLSTHALILPQAGGVTAQTATKTLQLRASDAAVVNPGETIQLHGGPEHWCITVLFDRDSLRRHLSLMGVVRPASLLRFDTHITTSARHSLLGALTLLAHSLAEAGNSGLASVVGRQIEMTLMTSLLLTQPHNFSEQIHQQGRWGPRRQILEAAALMREHPADSYTVADLSSQVGLSPRALHTGFRAEFGITPMSYLRMSRLEAAKSVIDTWSSEDKLSVTELASSVGFNHSGRFAADFTRRFGITPSAALRMARSRLPKS